ncbi:hypothetical protein EIP91_003895 [Steccherinum ochraceum]|uniref:DUF4470 domain-containing protein n=1 Tax=Steccherinum ochraceum TaxID=92696 RepID=A0A4R0RL85_9APHY|nr:hypothetical protein EIP91_003895 [Steccherinum ochraceum]
MSAGSSATELKEKGNAKFKQQQFQDAVKCYQKAEAAAPTEAVYPSNLSATFFELGDYSSCFQSICRAVQKLGDSEDVSPLFSRLSTRLAKTLCFGTCAGQISSESVQSNAEVIKRLASAVNKSGSSEDLVSSWADWTRMEKDLKKMGAAAAQARTRFSNLPIFRKSTDSSIHFFTIGHDKPMSIIDDWGPGDENKDPLDLDQLPSSDLSRLAFFFGGVGDARHVYGSITGAHLNFQKLSKSKKSKFKVHFTLLDVHPTALARDLCMFLLLDELARKEGSYDEETVAEIKATIFYTFLGIIVPPYCHARFHAVVQSATEKLQRTPPSLPSWLHVNTDSIPGLLASLRHWDKGLAYKTTKEVLKYHTQWQGTAYKMKALLASDAGAGFRRMKQQKQWEIEEMVRNMSDEEAISFSEPAARANGVWPCPGREMPRQRKAWLEVAREGIIKYKMRDLDNFGQKGNEGLEPFESEMKWYEKTKTFIPPAVLRRQYAGMEEAWRADAQTKPHIGYPTMEDLNMFGLVSTVLDQFSLRMTDKINQKSINADYPALSVGETFFDGVVEALRTLQGRITLEFLQGDLIRELSKMRLNADHTRPTHFPRSYMRMYLSNVPDYTHGVLNKAIYAVPSLECEPGSIAGSNCMLNKGSWTTGDELCYHYAHMLPHDMPKFLGCEVLELDPWTKIKLKRLPTPLPLKSLASRTELTAWLTRILFSILIPDLSSQNGTARIDYPNNLVVFLDLLIHLHGIGFPAHWLSHFLDTILSDTFSTDIAPYTGQNPIHPLNNILTGTWEALPFPVALPPTFSHSEDDLVRLEVLTPAANFTYMTANIHSSEAAVVGLLLFREKMGSHIAYHVAQNIHQILEGKLGGGGNVHVLTMMDGFDIKTGMMRWRMSLQRFKQMKAEGGWLMAPYRCDMRESVVEQPFPIKTWRVIAQELPQEELD